MTPPMSSLSSVPGTPNGATSEQKTAQKTELSSAWDGLSKHLIASFFEVDRTGKRTDENLIVKAPLTDASLEISLGWHSPFESAGEGKYPTFNALLQSGAIQIGDNKAHDFLRSFEGRTGVTKLNSTQVFNAAAPIKITVSALFRAWLDPYSEVERPTNQLFQWALPKSLGQDGMLMTKAYEAWKSGRADIAKFAFPSLAPQLLGMSYKSRYFAPLVIESIGLPLNSPVDKNGKFVDLIIPMTLCSLTAWDRQDWQATSMPL